MINLFALIPSALSFSLGRQAKMIRHAESQAWLLVANAIFRWNAVCTAWRTHPSTAFHPRDQGCLSRRGENQ
jgi:hypothetical protein